MNDERTLGDDVLPRSNYVPQPINSYIYKVNQIRAPPPVQQPPLDLSRADVEIVEEATQNLFGETIIVERPRRVQ